MEKLTKALMTDETGQEIVTKLTALSGQMHELAMATRGSAILFESESDISVLGDGGYLAVYVGSTNPLVISGWTGDNSLVTGHLYYLIKSGTDVASSDLGEYGGTAVTDTTLEHPGVPADAKAVGDAISGITIEVDDTLSEQGKAADAKAVGDAIGTLDERVEEVESEFAAKVASRYGDEYSPNLIQSDEAMTAGYISKDGAFHSSSSMKYTDYIPVKPGWVLTAYYVNSGALTAKGLRFVACYDESKNVVSSAGTNSSVSSFTVPNGIAFVKVTIDGVSSSVSGFMVSANIIPAEYTQYTPVTAMIETDFLTNESSTFLHGIMANGINSRNVENRYGNALPRTKIYQTLGLPQTWYNKSMVTPETTYIYATGGTAYVTRDNKSLTFKNDTAVTAANGYSWLWYDAFLAKLDEELGSGGYGRPRRFIAENLASCSLLCIGDSTVDHDTMTATILSHFAEQGATVTLLGTLGDGSDTNKNEGRAGWKATDYLTNKAYQGVTNPFYNPSTQTFDFSYYMSNQGYTGVDFVVLQLGINDLYNNYNGDTIESAWTAMETIIDSILSYNANVKIILNLPTTPNSDQSEHSVPEFLYRNCVIRYNEYAMAHALSKYGTNSVRCSYCHLILDPDTEIRDNVHPTVSGYQKMGLEVVNQINGWQAGV